MPQINNLCRRAHEIAKAKGWPVIEDRFTRDELYTAHEAFFTGTAAEVIPVVKVDSRTIGDGRPGPMTRDMMARFK